MLHLFGGQREESGGRVCCPIVITSVVIWLPRGRHSKVISGRSASLIILQNELLKFHRIFNLKMPAVAIKSPSSKEVPLDWFCNTTDMTISYGSIRPTSPTGDILQLQGNYEAINIGGFNFAIKYNKPVFADRLTYSLGLIEPPEDVQLTCDGSSVNIRVKNEAKIFQKIAGGAARAGGAAGAGGVVLRMESDSKETNKITYCKHEGQKIMWINFNFPQEDEQDQLKKSKGEEAKNILLSIV